MKKKKIFFFSQKTRKKLILRKIRKLFLFSAKHLNLYASPKLSISRKSELIRYLYFNAYQTALNWIKKKIFNFKYSQMIKEIKLHKFEIFQKKYPLEIWQQEKTFLHFKIYDYLTLYNYFFDSLFSDIFFFTKTKTLALKKHFYQIILSFPHDKFFLNFLSWRKKKNYFFLSPGLFLKYFGKKKAIKKNKILKLLMAKYTRKILLLLNLKNLILVVKQNPTFLLEFLTILNTPIAHKFLNPVNGTLIEDNSTYFTKIKFLYFVFLRNISFSLQKGKKKGRVKRKITRKLILKNALVD